MVKSRLVEPLILAIDTSCDETSAAVTCGRRVLSNVISSQVDLHKKYGGVYPSLAKRAHEEKIDYVVREALWRAKRLRFKEAKIQRSKDKISASLHLCISEAVSAIAVTQGPGLAIALEVGIRKAKELCLQGVALQNQKLGRKVSSSSLLTLNTSTSLSADPQLTTHPQPKLIAVNHLEGHIYSCLALPGRQKTEDRKQTADNTENRNPGSDLSVDSAICPLSSVLCFPALCLIVSGGHTELVLMKNHGVYEVIGQTLDDACGEALDKAAKILKLGYPGGPIIERLAEEFIKKVPSLSLLTPDPQLTTHPHPKYQFSPPLPQRNNFNFSYSGLKTQLLYLVQKMTEEELGQNLLSLAAAFQEACFEQIIRKTSQAIKVYQPKMLVCGGGVMANKQLRKFLRHTAKEHHLPILFPAQKNLITDNAAMIGIAAYYKYLRGEFVKDIESLDREPRMQL